MNNQEVIGFEEIRLLSEAFNFFKNKDYEHGLSLVKKVSCKYDESKWKSNKIAELSKSKCTKDDIISHLQVIGSKLKASLESIDKLDSYQVMMMYNCAVIFHIIQQNSHCGKLLDKLDQNRALMDDFTQIQFSWLRLENFLNLQLPKFAIGFIEKELVKDDNKLLNESNRFTYEIFLLKSQLQSNDLSGSMKTLEKLKRSDSFLQFMESNVLYWNRKLLNAAKCLSSSFNKDTMSDNEIAFYWNNLGCIYFHLNKHNLSLLYLNRSLTFIDNGKKPKATGNSISHKEMNFNFHYKIIHNLGIQLLFSNRPVDAFDLLLEVVNIYPKNPRLWLRLAECCIKAYNTEQSDIESKMKFVQSVVGTDKYKKIILNNEIKECKQPWDEVAAMPTPTLEFGSLCIRNAIFLLPNRPDINEINLELKNMNLIDWYKKQSIYVNPWGAIQGTDIIHLESSLLLNGAYISLCLNNIVETYKFSEKLLNQPILSPNHKYLARMYMSEAMLYMNSTSNIHALLNPATQTQLSNNPEFISETSKETDQNVVSVIPKYCNFPKTLDEAHSIMYFNLGVAYAIIQQEKLVDHVLNEALKLDPKLKFSINYIYLVIYHELRLGRTKNCLKILGEFCSNIPAINNIEV